MKTCRFPLNCYDLIDMDKHTLPTPPKTRTECERLWSAPPAAYRGKPFWSWNGALEIDELKRQVGVLKEMGMGGFFMHSRTGLETEYLGEEWFAAINATADEGERLGMEAWIYDEDRWPSGSAGGLATGDEAYRMRLLRCRVIAADEMNPIWPDEAHFIAAFVAELDGFDLGTYRKIRYDDEPELGEGEVILVFSWELMPCDSFYNGNSYLDTLNPDAVENFLEVTHDRYADQCGDRMGHSIPGVFTDEPHRGFVMLGEVWSAAAADSAMTAPWTDALPEAFEASFGESLLRLLPEIYFFKDGERVSPRKWQYMEILQRLFLDNWAKPCQERSNRHGLAITGHVLHEDSLGAQACPGGSVQRYYEYLDVPGIDVLGNANPSYWVAKQVQSVARQMGKPWILSELYGCTGWGMGFDGHKRVGDWQALFGVNLRCQHLAWYSMQGEAKRDYPASIFFQSSWWNDYHVVETYFSRLHTILHAGDPLCDVLVVNPIESIWAQIHPGWAKWLESSDPAMVAMDATYQRLFHWLAGAQIDFDYGDEDHIARFGELLADNENGPQLRLGEMRYRTVVVAGAVTLRKSTLDLLERFREQGGRIVFAGDTPRYVDALPSEAVSELAQASVSVAFEREAVVAAVGEQAASERLQLSPACPKVFAQVRRLDEGWVAVLLNTDEVALDTPVTLTFEGAQSVEAWDALSGARHTVDTASMVDGLQWQTTFGALQERVFFLRESGEASAGLEPAKAANPVEELKGKAVEGAFAYRLGEPNLLVLDRASVQIGEEPPSGQMDILRIEAELAERIGAPLRTGTMMQPWARKSQAGSDAAALEVKLNFEFQIDLLPDGPVDLLIEQPEQFTIRLNGHEVEAIKVEEGWLIDPCLKRIRLPNTHLKQGSNALQMECRFTACFDLEAVYLAGTFGVACDGLLPRMSALPETLNPGSVTDQGLFFYSDRIFYEIPVSETGRLLVEPIGAACLAFTGAGGRQLIPWGDFQYTVGPEDVAKGSVTCELILTRRNTLGPLHHTDLKLSFVGPDSFRSKGDEWTDDYLVQPAGLQSVHFYPHA
jgi:hypothetical protein